MPPNTVYVGRPTKWGNPYPFDGKITRQIAINRYKLHILTKLKYEPERYNLDELREKDLACWCPLDKPCHVDVLLEIIQSLEGYATPDSPNGTGIGITATEGDGE